MFKSLNEYIYNVLATCVTKIWILWFWSSEWSMRRVWSTGPWQKLKKKVSRWVRKSGLFQATCSHFLDHLMVKYLLKHLSVRGGARKEEKGRRKREKEEREGEGKRVFPFAPLCCREEPPRKTLGVQLFPRYFLDILCFNPLFLCVGISYMLIP